MNTKVKLLKILEILHGTDSETPLTASQIAERLKIMNIGLEPEEKSVCRDVNVLQEAGYPVRMSHGKRRGYYFATHSFEPWEVKILSDAVLQMRCITQEDTRKLFNKLLEQLSEAQQKKLKCIYCVNSLIKNDDKNVSGAISNIMEAMQQNRKVEFNYIRRGRYMEAQNKYDGYLYRVNPYALVLQHENYYLIANVEKYQNLSTYRLDRIRNLSVSKERRRDPREVLGDNPDLKLQEHVNTRIQQFSGEYGRITLKCREKEMDKIYDFAGKNVYVRELDGDWLEVGLRVQDGEGLIGWLAEFADRIQVLEPKELRQAVIGRLRRGLVNYEGEEGEK